MRDALDFRFAVAHRVQGIALAGWPFGLAGLAEVNSAQKLAHDQYVSSVDHRGAKRRTIFQSREANRRAQIREYPQPTAKTQHPDLGTQLSREDSEWRSPARLARLGDV